MGAAAWSPSGYFWLFGGFGYGANNNIDTGYLGDLWRYNRQAGEWDHYGGPLNISVTSP